jgi:hypothetical protein
MAGHFCADAGFGDECIRRCIVGAGAVECGFWELCNPYSPPLIIGLTQYGFCY